MQFRIFFVMVSMLAMAAQAEPRQEHFHAEKPASYAQAVSQLQAATQAVEQALQKNDLHAVHKQSYVMEKAIQRMQEELAQIAQDVETMHLASEKKQGETVRKAVTALAPQVQSIPGSTR